MARTPNTACEICGKPLYRRPSDLVRYAHVCCKGCRSELYKRNGHGREQLDKGRGWNRGKSKAAGDVLTYGRPRSDYTKRRIRAGVKAAFAGKPRKRVKKVCIECSDQFEVYESVVKRGNGKFCSRSCTSRFVNRKRDYPTGSDNPNWKGGPVVFVCAECGQESTRRRNGNVPMFCSRRCSGKAWSRRMINEPPAVKTYDTDIELLLEAWLTENKIYHEKQQVVKNVCCPDFFVEPNICIFADGDYWHTKPEVAARDKRVNKTLTEMGYQVIRLWGSEIHAGVRPDELLQENR